MSENERLPLSLEEIRQVAAYAVGCAQPALPLFAGFAPDDDRLRLTVEAAMAFALGGPRTNSLRHHAFEAMRAGREAHLEGQDGARFAALAAMAAAGAAYLHPIKKATQVGHILGAAGYAATALETISTDKAEAHLAFCLELATSDVTDVLSRYPRPVDTSGRSEVWIRRLDQALRGR